MADQDLIQRLFSIERQAESLVRDAETEAERRKTEAREKESRLYQEGLSRKNRELEQSLQNCVEIFMGEREEKLRKFSEKLHSVHMSPVKLDQALDEMIKKGIL